MEASADMTAWQNQVDEPRAIPTGDVCCLELERTKIEYEYRLRRLEEEARTANEWRVGFDQRFTSETNIIKGMIEDKYQNEVGKRREDVHESNERIDKLENNVTGRLDRMQESVSGYQRWLIGIAITWTVVILGVVYYVLNAHIAAGN
jgi:hypothetical protein